MSASNSENPPPQDGLGLYKIKSIAEFSGFNPNLLRAWERRYDLLDPERKSSGHRLYTEDDRRVLMAVSALMSEGRSIGEIAALGRPALLSQSRPAPRPERVERRQQTVESPQVQRLQDEVVAAALELDSQEIDALLDESFATLDRELVFQNVMIPAIRRIGELWSRGEASVAHERVASELFCRRIYQWWGVASRSTPQEPSVLVACLPDEQHEMGALLVTYYLTAKGANARYLGSLPLLDLELACQRTNSKLAMLSVTRPALFEVHRSALRGVIARNPSVRFVLGGGGLQDNEREASQMGAEIWSHKKPLADIKSLLE